MKVRCAVILACVIQLVEVIWGYQMYQSNIPNGEIVPHPCKANYIWRGVGHKNALGGGERNPFGLAFNTAGKQWTKALCQLDSDGDGKTNGQELGDPNCVWSPGQIPLKSVGLFHPGVCEPMNSSQCAGKNDWVDCYAGEFKCDAVNNNETKNLTVRFPATAVPPTETIYKCMLFDLPQDGDYHLVATKVILDNVNVMHHIVVYGCPQAGDSKIPLNEPYDCAMAPGGGCTDIIGLWGVGALGQCHHESSGFRLGISGYKRAAFQFHWNNPALINGTTDSSGMTFYYTPKLRPYDAGVLMIGQKYLYIPPGETAVTAMGTCPEECTRKMMTNSINIITAANHMHYLGIQQRIELIRNGSKVQDVTFDEKYSYESPVNYRYDNPIEVRPGDELKTTCVFKSTSRYKTTMYGLDTFNEMCYGFLTFYPKQNYPIPFCNQWKTISKCDWDKDVIQGCRYKDINNMSIPETAAIYRSVMENCAWLGNCQKECLVVVKNITNHPCFKGDIDKYLRMIASSPGDPNSKIEILKFYAALDSCNVELALEVEKANNLQKNNCTSLAEGEDVVKQVCDAKVNDLLKNCTSLADRQDVVKHACEAEVNDLLKNFTSLADGQDVGKQACEAKINDLLKNFTSLADGQDVVIFSGTEPVWRVKPLLLLLWLLLRIFK